MASDHGDTIETPNPTEGSKAVSVSQMAKKCLNFIDAYQKGPQTPLSKAVTIGDITVALTTAMPEFSESNINDALGSYLEIIEQHDKLIAAAGENGGEPGGAKTPEGPDEANFPWTVQENISGPGLSDELQRIVVNILIYSPFSLYYL